MQSSNEKKEKKSMAFAICAIMVGFTIGSVSSSCNITNEFLWTFWAILIAFQGIQITGDSFSEVKR